MAAVLKSGANTACERPVISSSLRTKARTGEKNGRTVRKHRAHTTAHSASVNSGACFLSSRFSAQQMSAAAISFPTVSIRIQTAS